MTRQDHKQGANSGAQGSKMTLCPMAASLFLRRLSCLCAVQEGEGRAPLAEGQYEDTEKQAKELRGFMKQCEKL